MGGNGWLAFPTACAATPRPHDSDGFSIRRFTIHAFFDIFPTLQETLCTFPRLLLNALDLLTWRSSVAEVGQGHDFKGTRIAGTGDMT